MSKATTQIRQETEKMLENVKAGEALYQQFAGELRAAGYDVSDEHGIDPETGQIAYMSVSANGSANWEVARAIFIRMNAANINIGIGSSLRARLWEGINSGAIKLHDFGFRRSK
jgi:hypothetical protein